MVPYVIINKSGHLFSQMDGFFCVEKRRVGSGSKAGSWFTNTGLYDIVSKPLKLNPNFKKTVPRHKEPYKCVMILVDMTVLLWIDIYMKFLCSFL